MKRLISLLCVLVLCLGLAVPALAATQPRLYDGADLLNSAEERSLARRLDQLSQEYQVDFVIATVYSTEGYGPEAFAEAYYDQFGFGYGTNRDGVILLVAMEDRDWWIIGYGFAAQAITDSEIYDIGDDVAAYLSDGEYADAFDAFVDRCVYEVEGERNGFPFEFGKNLLIALGVGLVAGLVVCLILAAQLKSVKTRREAAEYTRPGSMQLTRSGDLYLYRTVSRRPRPQQSSGSRGGGGGGRSSGGGKF